MTSEVTSVQVHLRHLGQLTPRSICVSAAKKWWARKELSWEDFVNNGIPGQVLLDTGDAVARRVVRAAEAERDSGR